MTAKTATILLTKIVPILKATVPRTVRPTGCEDAEELVADTIASAAEMLESVEQAGKKPIPRSIAFYSIQRARSGRRAYQCAKNDVLGPLFLSGNEDAVQYIDAPLAEDMEHMTMHDCIAAHRESPDEEALRRIDWEELMESLSGRDQRILDDTAVGRPGLDTARDLGVSAPRVTQMKRELGSRIKAFMGPEILKDISTAPRWRRDIQAVHEQKESRYAARFDDDDEAA